MIRWVLGVCLRMAGTGMVVLSVLIAGLSYLYSNSMEGKR